LDQYGLLPGKRNWKSQAPLCCKFFIWLAVLNRCWTADTLAKRDLAHPAAGPLSDQANHLSSISSSLVSCVFACQVWYELFEKKNGPQGIAPQPYTNAFFSSNWWYHYRKMVNKQLSAGSNLS